MVFSFQKFLFDFLKHLLYNLIISIICLKSRFFLIICFIFCQLSAILILTGGENRMSIGNNIRTIRKEKKMTLQQIADILGCSPQLISQYENGKRIPKIETQQKIANALDVPIYELTEYYEPIPDLGLQANIASNEKKYKLLLEFIRNMGYIVKFSGCPSRANMWMYDEEEKGFWTGDNFITSCQFGKKCETCKRRQITFYEISKNGKSVKIKITTMHGFFTMVENDIDNLLTLIFEHGDI